MGFGTRTPTSNEPPSVGSKNKWLGGDTEVADEMFMLLNGYAKHCTICGNTTHRKYLDGLGRCPDCRTQAT
jgi:hypothetical protein